MKATAVRKNGEVIPIFKKPVTDSGHKFSHKGIPAIYECVLDDGSPSFFCKQESSPADLDKCALEKTFSNGELLVSHTFQKVRERVRSHVSAMEMVV